MRRTSGWVGVGLVWGLIGCGAELEVNHRIDSVYEPAVNDLQICLDGGGTLSKLWKIANGRGEVLAMSANARPTISSLERGASRGPALRP